jgi:prepilin-type processing-associated H-X9-DG protein
VISKSIIHVHALFADGSVRFITESEMQSPEFARMFLKTIREQQPHKDNLPK